MLLGQPLLSKYDPTVSSDGSLDPLGLYPISDRLAIKLVPGLRERMTHPRFLTAVAVGSVICSNLDPEIIAADGVSEPWQVYEWYVVQALVRSFDKNSDEIVGVPGSEKVRQAFEQNLPLNSARYLKMPTVFGFHGVYRTLARDIDIIDTMNNLGETGDRLVRVWEKEQGLFGFISPTDGEGKRFRDIMFHAVKEGVDKGETARSNYWYFLQTIAKHLAPLQFRRQERKVIKEALLSNLSPTRAEIIGLLEIDMYWSIWEETKSERQFHQAIYPKVSSELKKLLNTIIHYERFCRLLTNAFYDSLYYLSQHNGKASSNDLAVLETVQKASQESPALYQKTYELLEEQQEGSMFHKYFEWCAESLQPKDWISRLINFHKTNQKHKPPAGKKPWVDQTYTNQFLLFSKYMLVNAPSLKEEYVNYYRTSPLASFLRDFNR